MPVKKGVSFPGSGLLKRSVQRSGCAFEKVTKGIAGEGGPGVLVGRGSLFCLPCAKDDAGRVAEKILMGVDAIGQL